jgi:hypothetical protein
MNRRPTLMQIIRSITLMDITCTVVSAICAFILYIWICALDCGATDICRVNYNQAGTITIESCEPIPNHEYWWWIVYSTGELQPRPGVPNLNYNPDYKLRLDYATNQKQEFVQLLDFTARPDDLAALKARAQLGQGKLVKATLYTNGVSTLSPVH